MILERINAFQFDLLALPSLDSTDLLFLKKLEKYFPLTGSGRQRKKILNLLLTDEQLKWLLDLFAKRWHAIADGTRDYTFDAGSSTDLWVKFARDLAKVTNKSYLSILMPTVSSLVDLNQLSPITGLEPRDLFVGRSGTRLYSIEGLYANYLNYGQLLTYIQPKDRALYPLSLTELFRLRAKQDFDLEFNHSGVVHANFWAFLKHEIVSKKQLRSEHPKAILANLLQWVECYFTDKSIGKKRFCAMRKSFDNSMQQLSIEDAYNLYGQELWIDGKKVYLIELLLDCFQSSASVIKSIMIEFAHWLNQQDASFFSQERSLRPLYKRLAVGPEFFKWSDLQKSLKKLVPAHPKYKNRLNSVLVELGKSKVISKSVIAAIVEIYKVRWSIVAASTEDYTRLQTGVNFPWIRLAQQLATANIIDQNYFQLLMPTLEAGQIDPILHGCPTQYPLSHYVLSEDGRHLILLDFCAANHDSNGVFFDLRDGISVPLSQIEKDRLAHANPRFQKYRVIMDKMPGPPISIKTVYALRDLVNGSLYPVGLLYAHQYKETQMAAASRAYQRFYWFYKGLSRDEKNRLNAQRIAFHNRNISFATLLAEVNKEDGCIAVYGQYFAQLVMDYMPWLDFRPEIEQGVAIGAMRRNSQNRVVQEYELSKRDVQLRLQKLYFSLLTHKFNFGWFAGSVAIQACSVVNTIPLEAKKIFDCIHPMIHSGNFSNAGHVYVKIMESIVKPTLREDTWVTRMTRHRDANNWLLSIKDESLFGRKTLWYEADLIVSCCFTAKVFERPKGKQPPPRLLAFGHAYFLQNNLFLRNLLINLELKKILMVLGAKKSAQLIRSLKRAKPQMGPNKEAVEWLKSLIQPLGARRFPSKAANHLRFFSKEGSYARRIPLPIRAHQTMRAKSEFPISPSR